MIKFLITILLLISTTLVFADEQAKRVATSTTNFNGLLSSSNTTVQSSLDTLDNLTISSLLTAGAGLSFSGTTLNSSWTQSGNILYNTNGQSYFFSNPITDYQFIGAGVGNVSHLSMFSALTFQGQTATSQTCAYTVSGNNVTGTSCDFTTTLTYGSIFLSNASSVASIVYSITDANHIAVYPPATAGTGYVFIPPEFKGYTDGGGSAA